MGRGLGPLAAPSGLGPGCAAPSAADVGGDEDRLPGFGSFFWPEDIALARYDTPAPPQIHRRASSGLISGDVGVGRKG